MSWRSFTLGLLFGLAIAVVEYLDMRQSMEGRLSRLEAESSLRSAAVPNIRAPSGLRDPAAEVPNGERNRIARGTATDFAPGLPSWAEQITSSIERGPVKLRGGTAVLFNGNDGNVGPQR
jgi:hypothetical protein